MAWIETIDPIDADGPLRKEYDAAEKRSGYVAHVLRISSLNPNVLARWIEMYKAVMFGASPLSRRERELVAVVVSQENDCHY